MGKTTRYKPQRLGEKLLDIRKRLGLSQNDLIRHMGLVDELTQAEISAFERGIRMPPLDVLLAYGEMANVYVEALIKDSVDLPDKLPSRKKHEGVAGATHNRKR